MVPNPIMRVSRCGADTALKNIEVRPLRFVIVYLFVMQLVKPRTATAPTPLLLETKISRGATFFCLVSLPAAASPLGHEENLFCPNKKHVL